MVIALVACTPLPKTSALDGRAALELTEVPFFPQEQYQCGPAALAEVLQWTGVEITPEDLAPLLVIPARKGTLQIELQAQARAQGRVPHLVRGDIDALYRELAAGHPVIVLQNLAFDWSPVWHYAVVVGIDPAAGTLTLRSGRERRHVVGLEVFARTWKRADNWAMVVLPADRIPATATADGVLRTGIALEQAQRWALAEALFRVAAERWPQRPALQVGYANSLYSQGRLAEAAAGYRRFIRDFPDDPIGYNNLALVLAELGKWAEAESVLARGLALDGPLRKELLDTQRELRCRKAGDCP